MKRSFQLLLAMCIALSAGTSYGSDASKVYDIPDNVQIRQGSVGYSAYDDIIHIGGDATNNNDVQEYSAPKEAYIDTMKEKAPGVEETIVRMLASKQIPTQEMHVNYRGGAVILSGYVDTKEQARLAVATAKSISKVTKVTNELVIAEKKIR